MIYNEDCRITMNRLDDETVDLVVTSPPYDDTIIYDGNPQWNFDIFKEIANNLYLILKKGGVIVWVVADQTVNGSETGTSFKQALYFMDIGFSLFDTMIYEKSGFSNPSTNRYHQTFEYMFILSKGKPKTFNPIKDRENKYKGIHGGEKSFRADYGMRFNVWRYANGGNHTSKDKITFKHPAPFPEDLAKDHILSWSNPQELVYDPFTGSGTTYKVCKELNRQFVGSEISSEYCKYIKERVGV